MKQFSGPRKTANHSESVHQQINMYAIAAVVTAVSVLALTQPAAARIVYTPANVQVNNPYNLDLNHDGITDFTLYQHQYSYDSCPEGRFIEQWLRETPAQGDGVVILASSYAAALRRGIRIGPNQSFVSDWRDMAFVEGGWEFGQTRCTPVHLMAGDWVNVSNRYLGLRFKIKGKTHYGWARLNVQVGYVYINATLTGYAYETIPGKSIKAGQKKEAADDSTNEDFGPARP